MDPISIIIIITHSTSGHPTVTSDSTHSTQLRQLTHSLFLCIYKETWGLRCGEREGEGEGEKKKKREFCDSTEWPK